MGRKTEAGQIVIELLLTAFFIAGLALLSLSLTQTTRAEQNKFRFQDTRGSK